jgi:hypothetical protein
MTIICLHPLERISDSVFTEQSYIAFLEPAYAGNHVSEVTLLISDLELNYYDTPVFTDYHKALNYANQITFGEDVYNTEEE